MYTESARNPVIQVTNFDVVARELPGRGYVLFEEYNGMQQIGNNRFNLLIDMYAESFDTHNSANNQEECERILGIIHQQSCNANCGSGVDCVDNRPRFLVKEMTTFDDPNENYGENNSGWEWRKLDEKYCKQLIYQTLMSRKQEKKNDLFEPISLLDAIGFGTEGNETNNNSTPGTRPRMLRRSQSASNMFLDAQNVFGKLLTFHEVEDEDDFEPLPITSTLNFRELNHFDPDLNLFGTLDHELNNRKKKRGRRRSLLRRSNSFESVFDKKKAFKNLFEDMPSSKQQPSFIRSQNSSSNHYGDSVWSSNNSGSPTAISSVSNYPDFQNSGLFVPTHQGLDAVFLGDCKTLSTNPAILGNNRLRILLKLESRRFLVLSPDEQLKTATDLVGTITNDWKGKILVEMGSSYKILSHKDATAAMHNLLSKSERITNIHIRADVVASVPPASNVSSSCTPSLLLAAAPPLPEFLKAASRAILSSGSKNCSDEMTERERQKAAIDGLKERNHNRQVAKQKSENVD